MDKAKDMEPSVNPLSRPGLSGNVVD